MKKIKIGFWNFWSGFGLEEFLNLLFPFLKDLYEFEESSNPDYLIYSNTAWRHMPKREDLLNQGIRSDCELIFFDGEYILVDMEQCDWAFTCNRINAPNHFYFPNYVYRLFYTGRRPDDLIKTEESMNFTRIRHDKKHFCNFLYSNPVEHRKLFYDMLREHRYVHSGGRTNKALTIGERVPDIGMSKMDKFAYLNKFRFTIAMENDRAAFNNFAGYTTEKLVEPMLVNSIPVYFGDPYVPDYFNTKSFVCFTDFANPGEVVQVKYLFEKMIEWVLEIEDNPELYWQMLKEPWLKGNVLPKHLQVEEILKQFIKIFGE